MPNLRSDIKIIESNLVIFADGPNTLAYRKFGIGFKHELDTVYVSMTLAAITRERVGKALKRMRL